MKDNTKDLILDIAEKTAEKYNGRTVVLWGDYGASYLIRDLLKERYGINVGFFVDSDENKVDDEVVLSASVLKGNHEEYFIAIPVAFYQSLKNTLIEYGYTADDYYYFCDCIVAKTDDYYEDSHGNKIFGKYRNAKIVFSGFNSVVTIGKRFKTDSEAAIYLRSNSRVSFGDDCKIGGIWHAGVEAKITIGQDFHSSKDAVISIGEYSVLTIGNNCLYNKKPLIFISDRSTVCLGKNLRISGMFIIKNDANLKIGDNFYFNQNSHIDISEYTEMIIGNDCMFSHDLIFYTNDAHSIFDVETGKNINSTQEISSQRKIIIGNHVWIGARSIVLYNTRIGDGSIIGAGSIVKSKIPNNCIAVGTPAKVVRRNVVWGIKNCSDNIADCGQEYIHMTEK